VFSPLLFNFALEYYIRKVKEKRKGMKLNGTHPPLVNANYVNLLRKIINIIRRNMEVPLDGINGISLEQGSPNYGPRATSGPRCDFIRPAKELCRNAPVELIFQ
jgi:hypothetical protein